MRKDDIHSNNIGDFVGDFLDKHFKKICWLMCAMMLFAVVHFAKKSNRGRQYRKEKAQYFRENGECMDNLCVVHCFGKKGGCLQDCFICCNENGEYLRGYMPKKDRSARGTPINR